MFFSCVCLFVVVVRKNSSALKRRVGRPEVGFFIFRIELQVFLIRTIPSLFPPLIDVFFGRLSLPPLHAQDKKYSVDVHGEALAVPLFVVHQFVLVLLNFNAQKTILTTQEY